jgi:hypothetical protein
MEAEMSAYRCDEMKEVTVVNLALPVQNFLQALCILEDVRGHFAEQCPLSPCSSPKGGAPPLPKSPNFS